MEIILGLGLGDQNERGFIAELNLPRQTALCNDRNGIPSTFFVSLLLFMAWKAGLLQKQMRSGFQLTNINIRILKERGVKRQLLGELLKRKLIFFGHIMRGSSSGLTLQIIEGNV